ncbi:LuxR family transcriptional regulator [Sphingosinicella sp. BN140058]|uniref:helix-turn-helix transcriptional regulator n=1 Tax=Sphingosinicella sp. BN140058 TaxID=1892855 RepID=UPI0010137769|nr:autoinducer binding domain-containing protein [Sphingosinicella sp. BN140058]QAY78196.1 LuxR family transcriptional regulator [Sphingosinicella sp. BN140058]
MFDQVEAFIREANGVRCQAELGELLAEISRELGFRYFALAHHVDILASPRSAIRLHNYPPKWAHYFDAEKLGASDPVHRASHMTCVGFAWADLPRMIPLTERDRNILALAGRNGIGAGYTVPAHVPGESNGSCSFATPIGQPLQQQHLRAAHLIGGFAFEAARRLWRIREEESPPAPRLTDRQRDCVLWAMRGKTAWEIGRILDVREDTVVQHLKAARQRYGGVRAMQLAVLTLFDGTVGYREVL